MEDLYLRERGQDIKHIYDRLVRILVKGKGSTVRHKGPERQISYRRPRPFPCRHHSAQSEQDMGVCYRCRGTHLPHIHRCPGPRNTGRRRPRGHHQSRQEQRHHHHRRRRRGSDHQSEQRGSEGLPRKATPPEKPETGFSEDSPSPVRDAGMASRSRWARTSSSLPRWTSWSVTVRAA